MLNKKYVRQVFISQQIETVAIQHQVSISLAIRKALKYLSAMNPLLVYIRPVKFKRTFPVILDREHTRCYNTLRSVLSVEGISILIHDYITNHEAYVEAEVEVVGSSKGFNEVFRSIDHKIMNDDTLSGKQKKFLLGLDEEEKELLYFDREMLALVDLDGGL